MAKGKKDACYKKVKARYKVWPSAYASGALVKCRKVGAANWGNKSKKKLSGGGEVTFVEARGFSNMLPGKRKKTKLS